MSETLRPQTPRTNTRGREKNSGATLKQHDDNKLVQFPLGRETAHKRQIRILNRMIDQTRNDQTRGRKHRTINKTKMGEKTIERTFTDDNGAGAGVGCWSSIGAGAAGARAGVDAGSPGCVDCFLVQELTAIHILRRTKRACLDPRTVLPRDGALRFDAGSRRCLEAGRSSQGHNSEKAVGS